MSLKIGDRAPDFDALTTSGEINFYDWLGESWGLIFSHPSDYTPVCTTELGVVANLKEEFIKRNVKTIALSVDDLTSHEGWVKDIEDIVGRPVEFPIIADKYKEVSMMYGMIHSNTNANFTIRSVFVVSPDKRIKLILTYPMAIGRNFDEILRTIDALQLSEDYDVVIPANWQKGDRVIVSASLSDEEVKSKFPEGVEEVKPYLKYVPQP